MFQTFRNAWKIKDLRKKILITFFIIAIFCFGRAMPAPFVDAETISKNIQSEDAPASFEILNLMTGGGFSQATLFALGATPYINASIIVQLLQVVIPALERWAKEGEEGRKKINALTKVVSVILSIGLSIVYFLLLRNNNALQYPFPGTKGDASSDALFSAWFTCIVIVATYTGGAMIIMWLADQIDGSGIGSGMSLIIFCGIISGFAQTFFQIGSYFQMAAGCFVDNYGATSEARPWLWVTMPVIILLFIGMFLLIIVTNAAERRIPVQYAKRVVGRKMYGGQNTNIPIKVNMTGVLPVIFASSFLSLPSTIQDFFGISSGFWSTFLGWFNPQNWGYAVIYALLIVAFNYFYVTVQYNPVQMANDLRKNSGMIPGIRPGQPTSLFISRVISKITFIGGIFLVIIATLPIVVTKVTGINIALGGTSLLIVVGVALEVSNTLESYMLMRHHKGFLE